MWAHKLLKYADDISTTFKADSKVTCEILPKLRNGNYQDITVYYI